MDPDLVDLDPESFDFCVPSVDSPLIDSGTFTGGALDYHGNLRNGSPDIGAIEY
jgi:hypothetical protein